MKEIVHLNVRKAALEDADKIAEISSQVAKEGTIKEFKPQEAMEMLMNEAYYVAVADSEGELLGYAMSKYSWGKLHILDIAVRKDRRGKGIGKKMVEQLILHAKEKGLPEAYCEVKVYNVPALNVFTGLGFKFRRFYSLAGGFYGLYLPIRRS